MGRCRTFSQTGTLFWHSESRCHHLCGVLQYLFSSVCACRRASSPGGRPAMLAEKQPDQMCWIHVWMTRWSARSTNSTLTWITASWCFSLRETHRLLDSAEGHQLWLSGMLDSDWSNLTFCGQIFLRIMILNSAIVLFSVFPG